MNWGDMRGGGSTTKTARNFENLVLLSVFSVFFVFFVEKLKIKNTSKSCYFNLI